MVAHKRYIPSRGDIAWITFDPVKGHEQKGRRPALVISPKSYNEKVGLALFCPITSHTKGYIFEVPVVLNGEACVVLSDHVRSLDWTSRRIEKIGNAAPACLEETTKNIQKILVQS